MVTSRIIKRSQLAQKSDQVFPKTKASSDQIKHSMHGDSGMQMKKVVPTSQRGSSPSSSSSPSHLSCRTLFHAECSPAPRPPRRRGASMGRVGGAGATAGVGVSDTTPLAASGCTTVRFPFPPCVLDRRPGTAEPPAPGLPVAPDMAANTQNDEAIVGGMTKML